MHCSPCGAFPKPLPEAIRCSKTSFICHLCMKAYGEQGRG